MTSIHFSYFLWHLSTSLCFFYCLIVFIFTHSHPTCTCPYITSNCHHSVSLNLFTPYPLQQIPGIVALSISIWRCSVDSWGTIDFHQRWHLLCALLSHCLNHLAGPSHLNWIRCQTTKWWADLLLLFSHENRSIVKISAARGHFLSLVILFPHFNRY